ncbi:MAG: hypothetical protein LBS83_01805 [Holosporales bacterium]|jgi:hypothetical protein|nr:hypothetical protein [Holosporales bacterium]
MIFVKKIIGSALLGVCFAGGVQAAGIYSIADGEGNNTVITDIVNKRDALSALATNAAAINALADNAGIAALASDRSFNADIAKGLIDLAKHKNRGPFRKFLRVVTEVGGAFVAVGVAVLVGFSCVDPLKGVFFRKNTVSPEFELRASSSTKE